MGLLRRLFGGPREPARPRLDGMADDDGYEDDGDYVVRGERGGLKLTLCAPTVAFVVGERSAPMVAALGGLGFEFTTRFVGLAQVAEVANTVTVELGSIEELIALQRRVGLPIRVEDGALEIVGG